ncbi:TetR family transcriptional regulator [Bosea sp. WAO]|uniref:TetR/AcrR family transcriptional regulator n=1 Tax=Bosea sp. WAO TaxID=406341 RepID=UPI000749F555|nr:TetR family transcriptional regulator C-terminal domain-containing protein [Bosea sp. WAO]KUL93788.1 TetR family transcriptional regulator [Bosea sp. WAO]
MTTSFRRAPDFDRRTDLIEATMDCIVELGIQGTSVRAVAAKAGVSNGLIRHHFASKENLIAEAYSRTIAIITGPPLAVAAGDGSPSEKLRRFVIASISGPVAAPRILSLWATFISQVHINERFREIHRTQYVAYRAAGRSLIAGVLALNNVRASAEELHHLSIALNAIMDGLWLEGCLSAEEIDEPLQIEIGLSSVERLLGIELGRDFAA